MIADQNFYDIHMFYIFLTNGFGYSLRPKAEVFQGRTFGYGRRWKLRLRSNTDGSYSRAGYDGVPMVYIKQIWLLTTQHHSSVIISLPKTIISTLTSYKIIANTENWIKKDKLLKTHWYWLRIVNAHYIIIVQPTYLGSIFSLVSFIEAHA